MGLWREGGEGLGDPGRGEEVFLEREEEVVLGGGVGGEERAPSSLGDLSSEDCFRLALLGFLGASTHVS